MEKRKTPYREETLHGGLRIHDPARWQLGDPIARLHDLITHEGIVVVPNVISLAEADEFRDGMVTALSSCNPDWAKTAKTAPTPGTRGHGLLKLYGIALSLASQRLRCHANICRVFAALYGTEVNAQP